MRKTFDLSGIPDELKTLPAWLTWYWRYDNVKKKWLKQPRTIVRDHETGKFSYAKAHCLRPLDDVLDFLKNRPKDGIGFSFHFEKVWPIIGIDLDSCRDQTTGELSSFAKAVVSAIDSYTEISVSGKGLHILARADIPRGRRKSGIEMYGATGYFAMTGKRLKSTRPTIEQRSGAVMRLYDREFPEQDPLRQGVRPVKRTEAVVGAWDRSGSDFAICREYARNCHDEQARARNRVVAKLTNSLDQGTPG